MRKERDHYQERRAGAQRFRFPKGSDIMVKEGPCCHCGIRNTPLWRNGPPGKPVLCNACGSRWRTRGTLNDYVPKHAMSYSTQMSGLPADEDSDQGDVSSLSEANTDEPIDDPNFKNVPRRRRSILDQIVLSSVERLHKQLYEIAHEEPKVFMKEDVIGNVLINQVDNMMSTQPETALGAMLLQSMSKNNIEPTESISSYSMKTPDTSASPENGGNGGDHGELSFT